MRSERLTTVFFVLVFFGMAPSFSAHSQSRTNSTGTGGIHTIQGRIFLPGGSSLDSPVFVELQSSNFGTLSVQSDHNGGFAFRSLAPGNYSLIIDIGENFEVAREYITIDTEIRGQLRIGPTPKTITVPIHLQLKRNAVLRNQILNAKLLSMPKAAVELYESAQKSISAGDPDKAIAELRQAIATHNAFSLAWNDLGVLLEKKGDVKAAIEAFKSAVRYEPESFAANLNLGCALTENKEYPAAEKHLLTALTKNSSSFRGHYYMGITQAKIGRLDVAEQAFLKAIELGGTQSSKAHYLLAGVYWGLKQYKPAADHLEKYLSLEPNAKDAVKVRESIIELRKKQN